MEIILSSSKRGYGLKELLSSNVNDYWSTEGNLPHVITIRLNKYMFIYSIELFLSYLKDDSYTPEVIKYYFNNQCIEKKCNQPEGYLILFIKEYVQEVAIVITSNHTDGKDSRIRHIRIMKDIKEQYYF